MPTKKTNKRPKYVCPEPKAFSKWYRRKVNQNLAALHEQGKSLRTFGFGVTEAQVNQRFKLFDSFERGDVLAKLQGCGVPAVHKKTPDTEITIAINPKNLNKSSRPVSEPIPESENKLENKLENKGDDNG
jgi:hypothetical protein